VVSLVAIKVAALDPQDLAPLKNGWAVAIIRSVRGRRLMRTQAALCLHLSFWRLSSWSPQTAHTWTL